MPSDATADVYDALAPIYDAVGGASFATLVADRLEPLLARETGAFLDLGCGTGALLCALRARHPGWRLCGVDVSPGMLAVARRKPGSDGVLWARARLPGPLPFAERFDVVGAFYDTLNHLPDLERRCCGPAGGWRSISTTRSGSRRCGATGSRSRSRGIRSTASCGTTRGRARPRRRSASGRAGSSGGSSSTSAAFRRSRSKRACARPASPPKSPPPGRPCGGIAQARRGSWPQRSTENRRRIENSASIRSNRHRYFKYLSETPGRLGYPRRTL